jgi:hypothetical protein
VVRNVDIKIKLAYLHLKKRIALYLVLWLVALVAGAGLLVGSMFYPSSIVLRFWSVILVLLVFIKLGYDVAADMKEKYETFKDQNNVTDRTLKNI